MRNLETDIEVIRKWGCSILLTFMEPGELESYHVSNLGDVAAAAGIRWIHIPITDGDPPDERFEASWPVVGREVFAALQSGKRIVINCLGGLGRTGMIACLFLIESGKRPREALELVRMTRPGSVETPAQESFIFGYTQRFNL